MPKLVYRIPKYRLHRQSGRGIVTLDGRDFLLPGDYRSDESVAEYDSLITEWTGNRRKLPAHRLPEPASADMTIRELSARYIGHAAGYYVKNGRATSEPRLLGLALRPLLELYADLPAKDFRPSHLKAVRQKLIDHRTINGKSLVRKTINVHIVRIRAMFAWGVAEELVPESVHAAIKLVETLEPGRTTAPDNPRVRPVAQEHIDAVRQLVSRQVRALIDLQLATAMRPGETVVMRSCDLTIPEDANAPWEYRPASHKTEHHGKDRIIYLGPKAKAVVAQFLRGDSAAYLFSPIEAESERRAAVHATRKTPLSCGNRPGSNRKAKPRRRPGPFYDVAAYRHAVQRACAAASIPMWHPHQLRHNAATLLRKEIGSEAARVVLGHSSMAMVEIYAERDAEVAKDAMRRLG